MHSLTALYSRIDIRRVSSVSFKNMHLINESQGQEYRTCSKRSVLAVKLRVHQNHNTAIVTEGKLMNWKVQFTHEVVIHFTSEGTSKTSVAPWANVVCEISVILPSLCVRYFQCIMSRVAPLCTWVDPDPPSPQRAKVVRTRTKNRDAYPVMTIESSTFCCREAGEKPCQAPHYNLKRTAEQMNESYDSTAEDLSGGNERELRAGNESECQTKASLYAYNCGLDVWMLGQGWPTIRLPPISACSRYCQLTST